MNALVLHTAHAWQGKDSCYVVALLFEVEACIRLGYTNPGCTSVQCAKEQCHSYNHSNAKPIQRMKTCRAIGHRSSVNTVKHNLAANEHRVALLSTSSEDTMH